MIVNTKELTYGDIERKFWQQNPNLQNEYSEYRPYGCNSIIIWFKNKVNVIVEYNVEKDRFEILKIDKTENI